MIYENNLINTIKKARQNINKKYNCTISQFNSIILKNLIYNINCHIVSVFKDYMIYDYIDEYLRRFYLINESNQRIPKFSQYYKNYIEFFCKPIIKNLKLNEILLDYFEKKAEYYYKKNYGADKLEEAIKGCENSSNNEDEEDNKIKVGIIFSNSIKKNIDNGTILTNTNNTTINLLSNEDTIELYTNNEEKSNDNTVRDIINEIYYKKQFFQRKKDSFRKLFQLLKNNKYKRSCNYKKLNIEKIHNIVKKNSLSNLNLNEIFKKNKNIYPSINNYLCKKTEKSTSKSKSHSKSKSIIIISNKSLSKSKNKNKLPIKNNKTRNINSNNNLKKNKTTINNHSKRKNINIYSTNSIHSITKSKEDFKLLKTQKLNKIINNLHLSYNHASFDNNSKKILITDHNLNKRKSPKNNIKPVTKIQKNLKYNNYFISKSRNNNNNGYMSQQILNLLTDSNKNYLRKKNYTNSNLNININSNNHYNSLNKNKHLKEYLNKKISHNENVSMNIRNNLKYLRKNINYKSIIPSFSQVNEKLITSYHAKNSNKLIKNNRPFSNVLKKYNSKSKSKEK